MAIKFLLVLVTLFTGMIAGLFYAYSCSVNLGLGRLSDPEYLKAMQSINRAILNPWFFTSFFGVLLLLPISAWFTYGRFDHSVFYLVIAALAICAIGVFGVTVFGNVPLNEALDKIDLGSITMEEIKRQRKIFENPWNRLNLIRTLAAIATFVVTVLALIKMKMEKRSHNRNLPANSSD